MLRDFYLNSDRVGVEKQQIVDMVVSRFNGGHALADVFLGIPGFDSACKSAEEIGKLISERAICDF